MTLDAATQGAISTVKTAGTATKASAPRFVVVDSLRGVAALWVVFCHAILGSHLKNLSATLPKPLVDFLGMGRIPVSIFFVLSGFVIAYSVSRYEVGLRFVGRFALRRSIRLDPPYWASIVVTIAQGWLSQFFVTGKSYNFPSAGDIAAHVFYLQDILQRRELNPAYWTLPLEIQFYLIFCVLLFLAHRTRRDASDRRSTYAIFIPAMLVSAAYPLQLLSYQPFHGSFLPSWYGFLIGMAACWAMLRMIPNWLFYGFTGLLCVGIARHPDINLITCVLTAVFLFLTSRPGKQATWLNWRWLLFLGQISYSLYLIHNPVTGAFYRLAYKLTGNGLASEVFWLAPMVLCNVVLAYGFWWLFERTSMALCHRIKMNKPSAAPEPAEIESPSTRA